MSGARRAPAPARRGRRAAGPAAVLWDMDGTLVDTEGLWWEAAAVAARRHGHRLAAADAPGVVGRAVADTAAHLSAVTGAEVGALASVLHREFSRRVAEGAPVRPGVAGLLAGLTAAGVPFALVSASPREVVDTVVNGALAAVPFTFTLSADDTGRTKPHPEPYREAARRLGLPPGVCLAIEDSPDGAASAEAAGCPVLVVPSLLPVPGSPRRVLRETLEGVDSSSLASVMAAVDAGAGEEIGPG